jgi:uncharacterized protein YukE
MAATIAVTPSRLRQAATAARAVGGRLLEVHGQLAAAAAGLDPALGGPGARSAFAALWTRWSGSVQGLAGEMVALAAGLEAAAEAYERSDRQSAPAEGRGAGGGGDDATAR